jgi:hypothetical protein
MNGYADRGNAVEAWIVERLSVIEQQGYVLSYTGDDQRSFYDVATGISGTPDGLLSTVDENGDDRHILLEFKSIDPRVNRRNLPKKAHVMQVQVNMHLVSLCLGIDIQEARLIYIDASDFAKTDEYIVRRHGDYWREAVSRSIQLNGAGCAEDLPPEGLKTGDCDNCNFAAKCTAAINVTAAAIKAGSESGFFPPAENSVLTNAEVDAVLEFLKLRQEADLLNDLLEDAKNETKAIVLDHGNVVCIDGSTISIAVQPGKETLDMKAVAAAGVDLSAYKKVGAPFTVMRVK